MATVATQQVTRTGLAPAYAAAAAGGDSFRPGPTTFLHIKNAGTAAITATVVTPGRTQGFDIADLAVTVGAGGEAMLGPLPADLFRDPADGLADITWSAVTSVTFAAISV
jgi:hypothetical protein